MLSPLCLWTLRIFFAVLLLGSVAAVIDPQDRTPAIWIVGSIVIVVSVYVLLCVWGIEA